MAPVPLSSVPVWRLSGSPLRTYPPSKGSGKAASLKYFPCSILKTKESIQVGATPNKRVRFSAEVSHGERKGTVAEDGSDLSFKGFTCADVKRLHKLRTSIKKIKELQESLTLKQRTAVEDVVRRKNGIIPIKIGKFKAHLCQNNVERHFSQSRQTVELGNVSEAGALFQKHLKAPELGKMQCRICNRIAYVPVSQQQSVVGGSNLYFCSDCFEKSAMCMIPQAAPKHNPVNTLMKTGLPLRNPPIVTQDQDSELLQESQLVITSVRSLASTMVSVSDGCHEEDKIVEKFCDDEMIIPEPLIVKMEKPEMAKYTEFCNHQVCNEVSPVKKSEGKTVTVLTAEGLFTVFIPSFGEEPSTFV